MKELKMMELKWPVVGNFMELLQNMPVEVENTYIKLQLV
jgi:hypothetical protein